MKGDNVLRVGGVNAVIRLYYGMRGLLKMLLQTLSNHFSFKKEK